MGCFTLVLCGLVLRTAQFYSRRTDPLLSSPRFSAASLLLFTVSTLHKQSTPFPMRPALWQAPYIPSGNSQHKDKNALD